MTLSVVRVPMERSGNVMMCFQEGRLRQSSHHLITITDRSATQSMASKRLLLYATDLFYCVLRLRHLHLQQTIREPSNFCLLKRLVRRMGQSSIYDHVGATP